jgi:predicted DNA-binding transcriptional regulator AlpA
MPKRTEPIMSLWKVAYIVGVEEAELVAMVRDGRFPDGEILEGEPHWRLSAVIAWCRDGSTQHHIGGLT